MILIPSPTSFCNPNEISSIKPSTPPNKQPLPNPRKSKTPKRLCDKGFDFHPQTDSGTILQSDHVGFHLSCRNASCRSVMLDELFATPPYKHQPKKTIAHPAKIMAIEISSRSYETKKPHKTNSPLSIRASPQLIDSSNLNTLRLVMNRIYRTSGQI